MEPMSEKCKDCGRSRNEGWLLIGGRCLDCDPKPFEKRRRELKAQAKEIRRNG
jgi:hypothetical protein